MKSLSAVSKALSTFQHASPSHNRFKLIPNKFLKHCNGVDHVSVPRKIRSAMKKRSRESTLSDSEKVQGIESRKKDGIKKSKKSWWPTSEVGCGAITKDEEEVAETLFSFAGMFPNNDSNASKIEPECQSLPQDSVNATFEASGTTQDTSPSPERSPSGAAKLTSLNETFDKQQIDFPDSAKLLTASRNTDQKQATPMIDKSENGSKVALHDSKLSLVMGLNVPKQSLNSQIEKQPDMEFEMVDIDSKQERHVVKDQKENEGPALWSGLSSRAFSGTNASYLQFSAAKAPGWLNAAICASKHDVMESCSSGIPKVVSYKKSWKSCAAHVHISHLIRSLEVSKGGQVKKEGEVRKPQQMRVQHVSKCGVLKEVDNLNGMRNGISSAAGTVHSSTRSSNEAKNGIIQQQSYYHDISQAPPTTTVYGPQNQSFNFLSLSSGNNGLKVNNSFNNGGSRLEPLSKYQVPYFQTMQQQHGLMPIPTPQCQYASTSYHDQHHVAGPQVRLHQPHYYGGPLSGIDYSSTVSNKQHYQSFWAVQLAAPQGSSAVNYNIARARYHNLQSGWHGSSSAASSCSQVIDPCCPEALGSKITSISEQQLFALASSLHRSRTNGLNIRLPSVCEESRGRFHSSPTPSLQLLCDERI
ncbi:PREDICTED: uncharacterized protein LOC109327504 isoform X3 [Lupinus angustifolius]|uniref:uncharacterized protein LOC109327504 isoform X3 n=1 Tax=Lupinus angustifolius TaxID=3871 RepID=UPI00092E2257|nr:PREDICTED: uncharacterized protein LOC109327504 isoform X3 [Lupinus angustifolius]